MTSTDAEDALKRDERVVRQQLGRPPRGTWRVAARCDHGFPQVIETHPSLDTGERFPTFYYLTCPYLGRAASDAESQGDLAFFDEEARRDARFAADMQASHEEIGRRRARAAGGTDPCAGAGVAGQADALATKCLHARMAAALAGVSDPVGRALLERIGACCVDGRCGRRQDDGI